MGACDRAAPCANIAKAAGVGVHERAAKVALEALGAHTHHICGLVCHEGAMGVMKGHGMAMAIMLGLQVMDEQDGILETKIIRYIRRHKLVFLKPITRPRMTRQRR